MKGFKGKVSAKIIAGVVVIGLGATAGVGYGIYNKLNARPDSVFTDNAVDDNRPNNELHTVAPEPTIDELPTEAPTEYATENPTEAPTEDRESVEHETNKHPIFIPEPSIKDSETEVPTETPTEVPTEIQTEAPTEVPTETPTEVPTEDISEEVVEVLAQLTNLSKQYIQKVTNSSTEPNLQVSAIHAVAVDDTIVKINGELYSAGKINNFTATINNTDTTLDIYNFSEGEISTVDFLYALNEVLTSNQTEFKLQLNRKITLSNQTEVVTNILQNRLNELNLAAQTTDVTAEIAHINKMLADVSKVKFSVATRATKANSGYDYAVTTNVNTGKYVYYGAHSFNSATLLDNSGVQVKLESMLIGNLSNSTTIAEPASAFNKALYEIATKAEELNQGNSLSK